MEDSGSAEVIYQMVMRLNNKNKEEAFNHFQKAAEMGHMEALRQKVLIVKRELGLKT